MRDGTVIAVEGAEGTDALVAGHRSGGILFKAPKPGQDRRIDLPVIGTETARRAVAAGLDGLVIGAGMNGRGAVEIIVAQIGLGGEGENDDRQGGEHAYHGRSPSGRLTGAKL